ncbi:MAG: DUF1581 domain-containing protein [Fuerstiella sp.]
MLSVCCPPGLAQNSSRADVDVATKVSSDPAAAVLRHLQNGELRPALDLLGTVVDEAATAGHKAEPDLSAAAGGVYRALVQLSADERFQLLRDWSLPTERRTHVRLLTTLVPEVAPPSEFARVLLERPGKDSFAISSVGQIPGLFCSAWVMVAAADDASRLRPLMAELEQLAAEDVANARFVLTLARLRDARSDEADLKATLESRVAGGSGVPAPDDASDAVLVAAALSRASLGTTCEQIAERLNQFDFTDGTSPFVPFLRRLRAAVILQNRSPDTDLSELFGGLPPLWISSEQLTINAGASGTDRGIWLTHEDHVKRLAGPGDDLLLFKYPLTGTWELKGEVAQLEHGGGGLTFDGLAFDASETTFTLQEVHSSSRVHRVWPFVASQDFRLFNRVNIRCDGEKTVFLSNLHPGFSEAQTASSGSPWAGLRAFGDGRVIFRNLELVGEPEIPDAVSMTGNDGLRGWSSSYQEALPRMARPFAHQPTPEQPVTEEAADVEPAWYLADSVIHGAAAVAAAGNAAGDSDSPLQSHLYYIRPLLDGDTISYEFLSDDNTAPPHPTIGRTAFLMEPTGVRLHWLTASNEWTSLPADNAVIEPLNRRGPRMLPLKSGEWNTVTISLSRGKLTLTLNSEEIYQRSVADMPGRQFGFYHDRNRSAVQIRNVRLTGDWPDRLTPEQLENLVSM